MMMKSIFKFYFILIGTILGLALIFPIYRFVDMASANSLMMTKIIIFFGYLYLGSKVIYRIIQFYYRKELIVRNSFNWTVSISNWFVGGIIIFGYANSLLGPLNALMMGIGCIIAGFIHLPRFIKIDKDSVTIDGSINE